MKMSEVEYSAWESKIDLPSEGKALVARMRASEPTRQSTGICGNVRGRYPSRKMGHMVSFDSHTVELPWIYLAEHIDETIIEYYEQPFPLQLKWVDDQGKNRGASHTPDFFVIRAKSCTYVECKMDEFLEAEILKHPGKFVLVDGKWTRPAAVAAAKGYGFGYEVWTPTKDIRLVRNLGILDEYGDSPLESVPDDVIEKVQTKMRQEGRVSLQALRDEVPGLTVDYLNILILRETVYVDLRKELLVAPEATWAYESRAHAEAFASGTTDARLLVMPVDIAVGAEIEIDGKRATITMVGENHIFLAQGGGSIDLPCPEFERLLKKGLIRGVASSAQNYVFASVNHALLMASPEAREEAARRLKAVQESDLSINPRTLARWKAAAFEAEKTTGFPFLGLLPRKGGNNTPRHEPLVLKMAEEVIESHYSTRSAPSIISSYQVFEERCEAQNVRPYSYQAFAATIRKSNQRKLMHDREGVRKEYSEFGTTPFTSLSRDTPPHGDHPFHIGHVDHTEMDVFVTNPFAPKEILRPWLTTLILAYCRLVVAYWLSFDGPSTTSILMVLLNCIRKHGRLPQFLVVDGGKEMSGNTIALIAAALRFGTKIRAPHRARAGSVLETTFHSSNCHLVHNLPGNSKVTKNVRQVTKSNDPRNLVDLSLSEFDERLAHYFWNVTPNVAHPALLKTPMEAFQEGLLRMGTRAHRYIADTKELKMLLSPLVEGGTRKVSRNGVKVDHFHYFHPALLQYIDRDFEVREDPGDCRRVFVKTPDEILDCECRARWPFFDRFPGHDSLISQVVLSTQAEILAKRSHDIHAGVASFQENNQESTKPDPELEAPVQPECPAQSDNPNREQECVVGASSNTSEEPKVLPMTLPAVDLPPSPTVEESEEAEIFYL